MKDSFGVRQKYVSQSWQDVYQAISEIHPQLIWRSINDNSILYSK